jgi:hypothetical protein
LFVFKKRAYAGGHAMACELYRFRRTNVRRPPRSGSGTICQLFRIGRKADVLSHIIMTTGPAAQKS